MQTPALLLHSAQPTKQVLVSESAGDLALAPHGQEGGRCEGALALVPGCPCPPAALMPTFFLLQPGNVLSSANGPPSQHHSSERAGPEPPLVTPWVTVLTSTHRSWSCGVLWRGHHCRPWTPAPLAGHSAIQVAPGAGGSSGVFNISRLFY